MAYTRLSLSERDEISRALSEDALVIWTMLGQLCGCGRMVL